MSTTDCTNPECPAHAELLKLRALRALLEEQSKLDPTGKIYRLITAPPTQGETKE